MDEILVLVSKCLHQRNGMQKFLGVSMRVLCPLTVTGLRCLSNIKNRICMNIEHVNEEKSLFPGSLPCRLNKPWTKPPRRARSVRKPRWLGDLFLSLLPISYPFLPFFILFWKKKLLHKSALIWLDYRFLGWEKKCTAGVQPVVWWGLRLCEGRQASWTLWGAHQVKHW